MIGMLPENEKRAAIACDDDGPDTGGNVTSLPDAAADCTQDVETFRAWAINSPSARPLRDALARPRADRPVNDYIDSYVWHHEGWENAGEHSVQTARRTTRGQAASLFARYDHDGDITQVSVWKRWVRPMTFADVWDYCGAERWEDRYRDEHGIDSRKVGGVWLDFDVDTNEPVSFEVPALPPDDWEPDPEGDPVWQFVHRSHPEAVPVWICGERGTPAPQNPTKTHEGESGN